MNTLKKIGIVILSLSTVFFMSGTAYARRYVHVGTNNGILPTITLVNHSTSTTGASNVTSTINTTGAGTNFFVVIVGSENPVMSISDNRGNSYTLVRTDTYIGLPNNDYLKIYTCVPTTLAASTTVTVVSTGGFPTFQMATFAGVISSPIDQQNGNSIHAIGTTIQAGSITPTVNKELIVAGYMNDNDPAGVGTLINGGFTITDFRQIGGSNVGTGMAYLIQTVATPANPTWTIGTSALKTLVATIMSFK